MSNENPSAASRLCAACGLCCNGVLFHNVRLQEADTRQALVALGLRVKHKNKGDYMYQPCPAHRDSCCTIYAERPERCRLFACGQLRGVLAGEISEADALGKIAEARQAVAGMEAFFREAGETNARGPLSKRYERLTAEPVDPDSDAAGASLRERMETAMRELDALLDHDFRVK